MTDEEEKKVASMLFSKDVEMKKLGARVFLEIVGLNVTATPFLYITAVEAEFRIYQVRRRKFFDQKVRGIW